jgi:hypothetical protein
MLQFKTLWNNHPTIKGDAPLLNKGTYENQCAVSMHACLERSGADLKSFRGARSWEKGKPKYALRAQELANWLATPFSRLPTPVQKLSGKDVFEKINGKTGIVFFENYWGPGNQGDHIDLWNGARLTALDSWLRIHARVGGFGLHSLGFGSDLEKSASAWFWAVT